MSFSRRHFLGTGIGGGLAVSALAGCSIAAPLAGDQNAMPDWHLAYRTAPEGGFDPAQMRLVYGKAPAGLSGSLYRNGPAQMQYGEQFASHWFDGDGLIHRIAIEDGQAVHSGRFVQTRKRREEQAAGRFLAAGFGTAGDESYAIQSSDDVNAANTSVIMMDGELLALWEAGSAFRMDPESLQTKGPKTWRSDLAGMPFLAHPKREPDGRVWNLGVAGRRVGIYRIGASGSLEAFDLVDIGAAAYIHDWAMTDQHLIIMVQPWTSERTTPPFINSFVWRPEDGLKFLIIDKDDLSNRRWAQGPARAFYHTGAAWAEADGTIRIDAALYPEPVLGENGAAAEIRGDWTPSHGSPDGTFTQIIIPSSGDARLVETDLHGDFPQVDPRLHGLPRELTALVSGDAKTNPGATALSVHNWRTGRADTFDFGEDRMVEEFLFVPKPGSVSEHDSWLVGPVLNLKAKATDICVFDAANVSDGPICIWRADCSWPLGFHGTWASA